MNYFNYYHCSCCPVNGNKWSGPDKNSKKYWQLTTSKVKSLLRTPGRKNTMRLSIANCWKLDFWEVDLWSLQPGFPCIPSDVVFPGNKMQITACWALLRDSQTSWSSPGSHGYHIIWLKLLISVVRPVKLVYLCKLHITRKYKFSIVYVSVRPSNLWMQEYKEWHLFPLFSIAYLSLV